MFKLGIFLLFCLSLNLAASQNWNWYLNYLKQFSPYKKGDKCPGGRTGLICKDCNTIAYCDGSGNEVASFKCSGPDPNKKYYCSEGRCVDDPSVCIMEKDPTFDCPNYAGFFRHPMDCTKFYYCDGKVKNGVVFQCSNNAKFDPNKRYCSGSVRCQNFSPDNRYGLCYNRMFQAIYATSDGTTYVICPPKGQVAELQACPKNEKFNLDRNKMYCEFSCPSAGFFPHPDKTKYYECVCVGRVLKATVRDCPGSGTFRWRSMDMSFCEIQEGGQTTAASVGPTEYTTISGSTVSRSTVTGSTVTGSTVSGSTESGSTVTGSTVSGSTESGSTVTGSTESGSTVTGGGTSEAITSTISSISTESGEWNP